MNELERVFERLLESKIRPEIREKISREAAERDMLANFLSQLPKRPGYRKPEIIEEERPTEEAQTVEVGRKALTGFPMRVFGEVFHAGDDVTAVVGDVEIPDGAIVDKPLVVKGKLKIGASCKVLRNLRALGSISIADGCSVKADIASGDVIEIGENTVIEGEVHSESSIKMSEGAGIYGLVDARGAYVSVWNLASNALGRGKEENGKHNH